MTKLKAFTIVELIVVMIISIITLATIYTVYLLVKKQILRQSDKTELLNTYLQFRNTFTADFNNADSVAGKIEDNMLNCYLDSSIVTYAFSERAVIRSHDSFIDSFAVFPHELDIKQQDNSELVNAVSIKVVPFADTVLLQLTKEYDANCLVKTKPN